MRRTLIRMFGVNLVSKVLIAICAILAIRFLSESEYALYTLALGLATVVMQTITAIYNVIYVVGFESLAIEKAPDGFLGLQLVTFAAVVLAGVVISPVKGALFWACVLFVICGILAEYSKTYHQQRLEFRQYSTLELVRSGVFLACAVFTIWIIRGEVRAWEMLAAQALGMLLVFLIAQGGVRPMGALFRFKPLRAMTRAVWKGPYRYLAIYFIMVAVLSQADIWALKYLSYRGQLAAYGAAFRYYSVLQLALATLSVVLLPSLQRIQSAEQFHSMMEEHRRLLRAFGVGTLLVVLSSGYFIPLLDGNKYPASVAPFRVLAISAIASFALSPHSQLLMRCADFRFQVWAVSIVFGVELLLLFNLVPMLGALGAALSTAVSFALLNGSVYLRARWRLTQSELGVSAVEVVA